MKTSLPRPSPAVTLPPYRLRAAASQAFIERQLTMARWVGSGSTVVAVSLHVPGAQGVPSGALTLYAWGLEVLKRALPAAQRVYASTDPLGPFELWTTPGAAMAVKRRCMAIEGASPAARLLDLDVFSPEGAVVDRASLQAPPRKCIACGAPARACLGTGDHAPEALLAKACELLAAFRS